MTIYDVLCYSKDDCSLSGKFCSINMLKGIVQSAGTGGNIFQRAADEFCGRLTELERACGILGENLNMNGIPCKPEVYV